MSNPQWEDVVIPQGAFIGWGQIGQTVVGEVLAYSPDGGTDFNNNACPQVTLKLTSPCVTYKDHGATSETINAGELVSLNAGQANLRRNVLAADPRPGDLLAIQYVGDFATPNGTAKEFQAKIARGAGTAASAGVSQPAQAAAPMAQPAPQPAVQQVQPQQQAGVAPSSIFGAGAPAGNPSSPF